MKTCKKCGQSFKNWHVINGQKVNLNKRSYCLDCSPFGKHNTQQLHKKPTISNFENRICTTCNTEKNKSEFYSNVKRFHSCCKQCMKSKTLDRFRKFKQKCVEYKGGKCSICGYSKCIGALHFHHRDKTQKEFSISNAKSFNFDKNKFIKIELDKCDLVCANCHAEIHDKMGSLGFEPRMAN